MKNHVRTTLALFTLILCQQARATLTTIGTATYQGSPYNLIYDSGQSLVWLDYTHPGAPDNFSPPDKYGWTYQMNWAAGLNNPGVLTYHLNPGVSVTWNGNWQLPTAFVTALPYTDMDSQFSYLYYTDLGNVADPAGAFYRPLNTGPFNTLVANTYWLSTEASSVPAYMLAYGSYYAFSFHPNTGDLEMCNETLCPFLGMVDAPATVTGNLGPGYDPPAGPGPGPADPTTVPAPGAIVLVGLGVGLVGWLRRRKELV